MRVKYIRTNDLGEMESTINLLLMQGWDRDGFLQREEGGYYLMCMTNFDSIRGDRPYGRATREAPLHRPYPTETPPQPEVAPPPTYATGHPGQEEIFHG